MKGMKKWASAAGALILAGMVAAQGVMPAFAAGESPVGEAYYVSTKSGSDTNSGTSVNDPFKTIQQAVDIAQAGDTVYIMEGEYYETVTPKNSGEAGKPITFTRYEDDKVTISGTVPVDDAGWTQYEGNIYQTSIKGFEDLGYANQVFAGEDTMWEARWPNIPAEYIGGYGLEALQNCDAALDSADIRDDGYTFRDDALTEIAGADLSGATVWCRSGAAWVASSSLVTTSNLAGGTVDVGRYTDATHNIYLYPKGGNKYYIFGALDLLDSPGEWYIDRETETLYLYAPDGQKPSGITMKSRLNAIDLQEKSHIHIEGLSVRGATINMDQADDCVLDSINMEWNYYAMECEISYEAQADKGLNISGDRNTVKNSTLAYGTGGAIRISGNDNAIVNNDIHDFNFIGSYACGISLKGQRSLVSHNSIHDVGRSAIQMDGYADIIEYNDLYNFMCRSADGGAVYTFANDGGKTEIRFNMVRDAKGENTCGIYLDNFTLNYIVHHNVVYNAGPNAISTNTPNNYMLVYNNTAIGDHWYWGQFYGEDGYGSRYFNNIYTGNMRVMPDVVKGNNISGTTPAFADSANGDYQLSENATNVIDKGIVIEGITDGYTGEAPDLGAYEYGTEPWKAGHDFENPPEVNYQPTENLKYWNLLDNGCFDIGMEHWDVSAGTVEVEEFNQEDPTHLKRGMLYKLRLGDAETGGEAEVVQVLTGLQPNTTYTLSGWLYTEGEEQGVIGVRNFGGETVESAPYSGQYSRKDLTFTTGEATSAEIYVKKVTDGTSYVYADDFGVQYVSEKFQNLLDKTDWTAEAYENTETAGAAIDGDYRTQWSDGDNWRISEINVGASVLAPLEKVNVKGGFSGITVQWEKISEGETYNVYRADNGGEMTLIAEEVSETYYTDTDVEGDASYIYGVTRTCEGYESVIVQSESVQLTVPDQEELIDFDNVSNLDDYFVTPPRKSYTIGDFIDNQHSILDADPERGTVWKLASNNSVNPGASGLVDMACAKHYPGAYTDVILSADIKTTNSVRISLRNDRNDGDSGYSFGFSSTDAHIVKRNDGGTGDVTLASASMPEGFDASQWHHYEFRVEGYTITMAVDGQTVISVTDESQHCQSGGFAFGGWGTSIWIDNINIQGTTAQSSAAAYAVKTQEVKPLNTAVEPVLSQEEGKWFVIDMKQAYQIDRVQAYFAGETLQDDRYSVYTSENGTDWTAAAEEIAAGQMGISAAFEEVTARYVKIVKTDAVVEGADYSKVDVAIEKAKGLNPLEYVNYSEVEAAIKAVVRGLDITHQAEVDAMAETIEEAIAGLQYKAADYSKVDAAIEKTKGLNPSDYENYSEVEAAIKAVVRDLDITHQAEVDAMAEAIEEAIAGLEKKENQSEEPDDTSKPDSGTPSEPADDVPADSPNTSDSLNIVIICALMLAAAVMGIRIIVWYRKLDTYRS